MPKAITSTPKIAIRTEVGAVAWRRTHHAVDNAVPVKPIVIRRRPDRSSAGPNESRSVAAHRNSAAKMTAAQLVYWITRLVVSSGDRSGIAARIPAGRRKPNGFGPKRGQTESVCSLLPVSPVVLRQRGAPPTPYGAPCARRRPHRRPPGRAPRHPVSAAAAACSEESFLPSPLVWQDGVPTAAFFADI